MDVLYYGLIFNRNSTFKLLYRKVLLGIGVIETSSYVLLALAIFSGFVVLYSLLRIFMSCFWGETIISKEEEIPISKKHLVPSALLVLLTIGIGFGVEGLA